MSVMVSSWSSDSSPSSTNQSTRGRSDVKLSEPESLEKLFLLGSAELVVSLIIGCPVGSVVAGRCEAWGRSEPNFSVDLCFEGGGSVADESEAGW